MSGRLHHLQINVRNAAISLPFYRDLLSYLDYRPVYENGTTAAYSDGTTDLWFFETDAVQARDGYHRKRIGLNHLAFKVVNREAVDLFVLEFMQPRGIVALYETPREFPEYGVGYYAVFFEDPDRMKLEVACVPVPGQA